MPSRGADLPSRRVGVVVGAGVVIGEEVTELTVVTLAIYGQLSSSKCCAQ